MIDSFTKEYRYLSNFFTSPIEVDGEIYPTAEHAYHAAKTSDPLLKKMIRGATTPGKAKGLGHDVPLRRDWEEVKISIMKDLLKRKFSIPELKEKLLETKGHELIEGNYWNDTFWGVCGGVGENHLGKLLMEIRNEIY